MARLTDSGSARGPAQSVSRLEPISHHRALMKDGLRFCRTDANLPDVNVCQSAAGPAQEHLECDVAYRTAIDDRPLKRWPSGPCGVCGFRIRQVTPHLRLNLGLLKVREFS